ncbi:interleukin-8-like [Elgaria multicarinata webbii]|uniref:interleukin-8-like n=1 Tax=Elgaria multicarinata webbii TaxID=159646 RepID=UPI002FCD4337
MGSHRRIVVFALFIAIHISVASIFVPVNLSCKCRKTTSKFVRPKDYESVEIFPAGVACTKMQIIITLKNQMKKCVDPEAKWVKNLVRIMERENKTV